VIAAFGVIDQDQDQILIVGAMAVSPDLLPVTAACTGLVLRRRRLIRDGLASLLVGCAERARRQHRDDASRRLDRARRPAQAGTARRLTSRSAALRGRSTVC